MIFSDYMLIEIFSLVTILYFLISTNIMMLLYTAGLYLTLIGLYSLLNDADIYIGFLWVIDLGVGLVFFIFMLHFTSFLQHKSLFNTYNRFLLFTTSLIISFFLFFYFFSQSVDLSMNSDLLKL